MNNDFYPDIAPLDIELHNYCNLKCPYCSHEILKRPKGYMAWDLIEKIVSDCVANGHEIGSVYGTGEPLINENLESTIEFIMRRGAGKPMIQTNGTLLTPERSKKLIATGIALIGISLDTLDPDIYRATRGGNFDSVIQNIKALVALAPKSLTVRVSLMNHKHYTVTDHVVDQFDSIFGKHDNLSLCVGQAVIMPGAADYRASQFVRTSCIRPRGGMKVAWDGRIGVCCYDLGVEHCIGNLNFQTISEVWHDPINQSVFGNLATGRLPFPSVCSDKCGLRPKT